MSTAPNAPATEIVKKDFTPSERFTQAVERQYSAEVGKMAMTEYDRTLLQHLFIKCDAAFIEANSKSSPDKPPITWVNVNMTKLAIDAVNRIRLGIDGLVPGHLYPIAYFNGRTKKYDIDLRIGYKGEAYYVMNASLRPIRDLRVELVYSTDEFTVYKKGISSKIEGYDFKVNKPFDRGDVVGGFAYIEYEDEKENLLIVLSKNYFEKTKGGAQSQKFWGAYYDEMCYKTLVHRAVGKITLDPRKINIEALAAINAEDYEKDASDAEGNGAELILDPDALKGLDTGEPTGNTTDSEIETPDSVPSQIGMPIPQRGASTAGARKPGF